MAKTHYAWSQIKSGTAEKPIIVERGSKVTASDLGVKQEDFQAMVDAGAIRNKPFTAPDDYQGSAIDFLRDQLAEAMDSSVLDEAAAVSELEEVETAREKVES